MTIASACPSLLDSQIKLLYRSYHDLLAVLCDIGLPSTPVRVVRILFSNSGLEG